MARSNDGATTDGRTVAWCLRGTLTTQLVVFLTAAVAPGPLHAQGAARTASQADTTLASTIEAVDGSPYPSSSSSDSPLARGTTGVSSARARRTTRASRAISAWAVPWFRVWESAWTSSYQFWHIYLRAGGGLAWGSQDLEIAGSNDDITVQTASGVGIGYSAGAGLTLPIASVVSLAFFGNWNVGHYDMISAQGVSERGLKHEYLELGVGLALR